MGLLVHAQHDGALGRVQVGADDVLDLVHEQRVRRQLPGLLAIWLQAEGPPDPRDRGLVEPDLGGHRPGRPRRGITRCRLQGLGDDLFNLRIAYRAGPTGPRLVEQSIEAIDQEPGPPLANGAAADPTLATAVFLSGALALGAAQHNP